MARPLLALPRDAGARLAPASSGARRLALVPTRRRRHGQHKYFLVNLPATASWHAVVHLAHQRWAIETTYAELKSELGLDDFVGRSYPGWNRHVALTALAYAFLQVERQRHGTSRLTFPQARAVMTDILTAYYFVTHQRKLKMLLKLAEIPLRI